MIVSFHKMRTKNATLSKINDTENQRINQKWTIQISWKHWVHKTKTNKTEKNICVGHHYSQTNTNDINKIGALLQTTGGKGELNIIFMQKS